MDIFLNLACHISCIFCIFARSKHSEVILRVHDYRFIALICASLLHDSAKNCLKLTFLEHKSHLSFFGFWIQKEITKLYQELNCQDLCLVIA